MPLLSGYMTGWLKLNAVATLGQGVVTIFAFVLARIAFSLPMSHRLQYTVLACASSVIGFLLVLVFAYTVYPATKQVRRVLGTSDKWPPSRVSLFAILGWTPCVRVC